MSAGGQRPSLHSRRQIAYCPPVSYCERLTPNLDGGQIVTILRYTLCVLICLMLISTASWAQQDGTITGRISDSSGALLPGVGITITSPQLLGGERTLV